MEKARIRKFIEIALLIAIEVVVTRFCSITTPIIRIGFGFIPIAIAAMLYGPVWAGLAAVFADLLGAILFPVGAFSLGFTLTAALTGMIYGIFLYKKVSMIRIVAATLIITLLLNLCLDTLWLQFLTGKAYVVLLPLRIIKCTLMAPIQMVAIRLISGRLYRLRVVPSN